PACIEAEDFLSGMSGAWRKHLAELTAEHGFDEVADGQPGGFDGGKALSVAQHRDLLGKVEDLRHAVGDIDDGTTLGGQGADGRLDAHDFRLGEGCRRLVRMAMRALRDRRRAISTSWRSATECSSASDSGSI